MDETREPGVGSGESEIGGGGARRGGDGAGVEGERFRAGVVVGGRYRVVSRLGKGGMGEVYRADDLTVGASVALKFLPVGRGRDAVWRDRLMREVKVAREVTHPNVCRVYDVGETGGESGEGHRGQLFLTMEYIDGEDLSSLLKRIGRFSEDRAVEVARQICLGLAAAHEEGVLHRDLKPANVMLDGRGRIKITDFGLAALAERVEGAEARSGTVGYMAPEQRAGKEVTRKSDIYSLGLVLFEVFTGKKWDESRGWGARTIQGESGGSEVTRTRGGSGVGSGYVLDPAVERVIARCLRENPEERPVSAFAVAAALPGGDPLQAAVAAGETPSPEMVADAGSEGRLGYRGAVFAVVLLVVGFMIQAWVWDTLGALQRFPEAKSPPVLVDRAKTIIGELGYVEAPTDSYWGLWRRRYPRELLNAVGVEEGTVRATARFPAQVGLFYRQASTGLAPVNYDWAIGVNNPPRLPGNILVRLSNQGDLVQFEALGDPWEGKSGVASAEKLPGVREILTLTGMDSATLKETEPRWLGEMPAVIRRAYVGKFPKPNDYEVRVELGFAGGRGEVSGSGGDGGELGRLVSLSVSAPWELSEEMQKEIGFELPPPVARGTVSQMLGRVVKTAEFLGPVLTVLILAVVVYLTAVHLRSGKADVSGAVRLGLGVVAMSMVSWGLMTHYPRDDRMLTEHLMNSPRGALLSAAMAVVAYLALEPFVRSHWPQKLIGSTRLLAGRVRNPVVGGEVLVGMACGVFGLSLASLAYRIQPGMTDVLNLSTLPYRSALEALGEMIGSMADRVMLGLLLVFVLVALRKWTGRMWLATALAVPTFFLLASVGFSGSPDYRGFLAFAIPSMMFLVVAVRFGLLAVVAAVMAKAAMECVPTTLSTSVYWFDTFVMVTLGWVVFTTLVFRVAVSGLDRGAKGGSSLGGATAGG